MSQRFLAAAEEIGYRLCRDAFWAGDRCAWFGPCMEPLDGTWQVVERLSGPDLYEGTAGIAFFLAHLHAATGERTFRRAAEGAARQTLVRRSALSPPARTGVYAGELGVALALTEIGRALDDPGWTEAAEPSLARLLELGPEPGALDVVAGSAGAVPALLALAERLDDPRLEALALRHGEAILGAAQRAPEGWSWDTLPGATEKHLTGFAHGAAGMGWALLELFGATRDERFREGAEEAFRYEQSVFDAKEENWPDFREPSWPSGTARGPVFAVAWCHGAPGVGLTRLRACELLEGSDYGAQAKAAIRTARKGLQAAVAAGGDASLCHGSGGLSELLLMAADSLREPAFREEVLDAWADLTALHHRTGHPWPCGVRGAGEAPGLMTGVAGIGLHLLRLAREEAPPPATFLGPSTLSIAQTAVAAV